MDVLIIGAGGHGRVVLDILRLAAENEPVGFIDADPSLAGTKVGGLPVLGPVNLLGKLQRQGVAAAVVAIGDNRTRAGYAQAAIQAGLQLINAIHPSAVLSETVKLGRNIVIAAGAIVNPDAEIGDSAIINTAAVVEHECKIGPAVHICPGVLLAGRVTVGEGAMIGIGARILPCLSIGAGAIVGAGAVVIEDVPAWATVVGVPAKVIKVPAG